MRFMVDIAEATLRRMQDLMNTGRFSDMSVFVSTAIENQISLESSPMHGLGVSGPEPNFKSADVAPGRPDNYVLQPMDANGDGPSAPVPATVSLSVDEAGWIWGLLNRLLPLKVAARAAANLTIKGPVRLSEVRKELSRAAAQVGAWLASIDRDTGLSREDRLATAFPVRNPADKSLARYADHFVGRVTSSGDLRGGLFELGLAGVMRNDSNDPQVALTDAGWQFARLPNSVLDDGAKTRGLSRAEADSYVANAIHNVPREKDCLLTILSTLAAEASLAKGLDVVIRKHFASRIGEAEATTLRAGALGRLFDLGLLCQSRTPDGARWDLSDHGREVFQRLQAGAE